MHKPRKGEVWESKSWGYRVRVQGYTVDGRVKLREVGGERARWSVPLAAFRYLERVSGG